MKENPLSLQASLTPENFPHVPPLTKRKVVSLSESGGDLGEVFCRFGRCGFVAGCGFALFLWGDTFSQVYLARVPLTSNIHPMRNDTWVVPYNAVSFTDSALCRVVIRRERHTGRSAFVHQLTFYHFYPVAERAQAHKSRSTGFGSEQPEFVARSMATSESAQ